MAHRYSALAVFDEVKVDFAWRSAAASEYYGVTPDLATYGKACCNGFPGSFRRGQEGDSRQREVSSRRTRGYISLRPAQLGRVGGGHQRAGTA